MTRIDNLTVADLGTAMRSVGKRSKYGVAPKEERTLDGVVFDSKAEMHRWQELKLLERAGEISHLMRQVRYPLAVEGRPILIRSQRVPNGRQCQYRPDFIYHDHQLGKWIYEDVKGFQTAESKLRIAVFEAIYNTRVLITRAS